MRIDASVHPTFPTRGGVMRTPAPSSPARNHHPTTAPRPHPGDRGMSTVEYALCTLAAAAFAVVLYAVLTSDEVRQVLLDMVTGALNTHG
ncbi:DUF4244 domain-containing protein [Lipingzhangella sp. LS1_29]|uniref:DUF4244 domain-containing protein n=1 Tax=Lipingzhangella rawalii TaxID=2055835 RepID=A0ABU2H3Z6_9ACTN|nr:DUF4244 domain-containing protein [Lipingzhangella rawalii]MDS1270018.1 DUF4244 domain-containing protein [Lipingzhangella rawalii]